MNNLFQIYSCIKKEQKPIIQFLDLKKIHSFFNNFKRYISFKIICICLSLFFLLSKKITFFLVYNFFLFLLFILVFLIFKNVSYLLSVSKLYYEESSWFDLKIWQKPIFLIKNDKIFSHFQKQKQIRTSYINTAYFLCSFIFFVSLKSI